MRGGAYKPRTAPTSFQGLGVKGLEYLAEAREATGLPVITEVMTTEAVPDRRRICRHSANRRPQYAELRSIAGGWQGTRPVMLKRGISGTVEELLMCAEYIVSNGNYNVMLCERGIRTYETATRNTFDLNAIPVLKQRTHLPVVADPSHGTGFVNMCRP